MKKLIRILKKRRNHGFSMVEMIVAVALLALLLGGMMITISPILQSYNDNQTLYTAENVATCIQEEITHTLRNAYQVNIFTDMTYTDNWNNTSVQNKIKAMADYVNAKNADTAISSNRVYELKCLSLRYNEGQYYLCNENVNTVGAAGQYITGNANNAALDSSRKCYSDVLLDGLYMDFGFSMPTETKADGTAIVSKDTFKLDITAYSDADKKSIVYAGSGLSECFAVKTMLRAKAPDSDYFVKISSGGSATGKDIYIYYVARRLKGVTSTP